MKRRRINQTLYSLLALLTLGFIAMPPAEACTRAVYLLISVVGLFFARLHITGKWSLHKFGNHEVENRKPQYETEIGRCWSRKFKKGRSPRDHRQRQRNHNCHGR